MSIKDSAVCACVTAGSGGIPFTQRGNRLSLMAFWGLIGVGIALEGIGIPLIAQFDEGGWRTFGYICVVAGVAALFAGVIVKLRETEPDSPGDRAEGGSGEGDIRGNVIKDSTITITKGGEGKQESSREVVEIDLVRLTGYYRQHTTAKADSLAKPALGKWAPVSGTVIDVSIHAAGEPWVIVEPDDQPSDSSSLYVTLAFHPSHKDRVLLFDKGDAIRAIGVLQNVRSDGAMFEGCEIQP
jgi:hypothetical protein